MAGASSMQLCRAAGWLYAARHALPVIITALLCARGGEGGNQALFTVGRGTLYNVTAGWLAFPPELNNSQSHFIGELDFSILPDTVVSGGADALYFLATTNFSLVTKYNWKPSDSKVELCQNTQASGDPESLCHNYIRVYHSLPSNASHLFVCGTQAEEVPQCRLLVLMGEGDVLEVTNGTVPAGEGLISYYTQYQQFGQFRRDFPGDPIFITGGHFQGIEGAGRLFSIAYYNITTTSDPAGLRAEQLFSTLRNNRFWLLFPVTFVGVHRMDYPTDTPSDYQFWFVFVRENSLDNKGLFSHVVRICRNDEGSNMNPAIFNTYVKARILCKQDKPASRDFINTLDYEYNSITSFAFSTGRYYGDEAYKDLLYGAFTGSRNGPIGSAVCAYPTTNTAQFQGNGRSNSLFDVFRSDLTSNPLDPLSLQTHTYTKCNPSRLPEDEDLLFTNPDNSIEQIGEPIFLTDGVIITHMVVDKVCVVMMNMSSCIKQDVLFLGTDAGSVLKVVFVEDSAGQHTPAVAEEIKLDSTHPVESLKIMEVIGEKFLFVSTRLRLYKLPLQRCGRFLNQCSCHECLASRDPYCVWDITYSSCLPSPLTTITNHTADVPEHLLQNVHTGTAPDDLCNCPVVSISSSNYKVDEGAGSVSVVITSSTKRGTVQLSTSPGSADHTDYTPLSTLVNFSSSSSVSVSIAITDDMNFEPPQTFTVALSPIPNNNVVTVVATATITIDDNDGKLTDQFQIGFSSSGNCTIVPLDDSFTASLVAVVSDVIATSTCCSANTHITDHSLSLSCLTKGQYYIFTGRLMVGPNQSNTSLGVVREWVTMNSTFSMNGQSLTTVCFKLGGDGCPEIYTSEPSIEGVSSGSENSYSKGAFVSILILFLLVVVVLAVAVVILLVWVWMRRQRKRSALVLLTPSQPPPSQHPPSLHLCSYQEAMKLPVSKTPGDYDDPPAPYEPFPGFARPSDGPIKSSEKKPYMNSTWSDGVRGDSVSGDGVSGEGGKGGMSGDGMSGEGVSGDGVRGKGVSCEGVRGEGVSGDGVRVEGVSGDGVRGEGVSGDGVRGEGVSGDGVMGEGVSGDGSSQVTASNGGAWATSAEDVM